MSKPTAPARSKKLTAANALVTGVSTALALVLLNALSCQARSKLDLTENGIYTLSPASSRIARNLPEKVRIKAYFGNIPAEHKLKEEYVTNLLVEYAGASGGKLEWEKIDPWGDTALQEELKKEGITPVLLLSLKEDKQEQVPVFFTVFIQYLDKKELWQPQQSFTVAGLEYELSTRIKRLAYGKKKVGVTSGFGEPEKAQGLQELFGDIYEVQLVDWSKEPSALAGVDALIVNGPTNKVSEEAKQALDQHVMQGKPVVFLLRGIRWQPGSQQEMLAAGGGDVPYLGSPADHGLGDLLAHWGFEVASDTIVDGRNSVPGLIPMGRAQPLLTSAFFPLTEVLAHGEGDPLPGMKLVPLAFASTVNLVGPMKDGKFQGEVRPLLRTSPVSFARSDVMVITREMTLKAPENGQHPREVAYMAKGKFASFYPDKAPPPPAPGEEGAASTPAGALKESPATTRMVVVGSSEFAEDKMFAIMRALGTDVYLNGFRALHNMLDWTVEDTDFIAVRTKEVARPLEPLESERRLLVKYANVAGAPLAVILFGVVYWRVRERRRRSVSL